MYTVTYYCRSVPYQLNARINRPSPPPRLCFEAATDLSPSLLHLPATRPYPRGPTRFLAPTVAAEMQIPEEPDRHSLVPFPALTFAVACGS